VGLGDHFEHGSHGGRIEIRWETGHELDDGAAETPDVAGRLVGLLHLYHLRGHCERASVDHKTNIEMERERERERRYSQPLSYV
jgi:hypothetical protein